MMQREHVAFQVYETELHRAAIRKSALFGNVKQEEFLRRLMAVSMSNSTKSGKVAEVKRLIRGNGIDTLVGGACFVP